MSSTKHIADKNNRISGIKRTIKSYIPFYKRNLNLAIPVMISQLGQSVVMLADSIMTGQLGTNALAATSFANAIFIIGFVLAQGIGFGATPLIGPQFASGNYKRAGVLFHHSIYLDMLAAFGVGGLMYIVSYFLDCMGQDEEVVKLAIPYYQVLVLSLIPYMLFLSFKQFMEGIGNTKYAMIITIISNIINIVFNYLLIFGKCGFPQMGVLGAGVASLIARCSMPICYILLFRYKNSLNRYFLFFNVKSLNWKDIKSISKMGLPIGIQMFIECLVFSLSAVMAGWFGAIQLASHQIAINLSSLTFMVVTGISSATTIVVSHNLGQKRMADMKQSGLASLHITLIYSISCGVIIYLFRHLIPLAFSRDPSVIELSAILLTFAAIYQIADGLQSVGLGALRGMGDVHAPMYIATFSYICINLPAGYIMAEVFGWEAKGVWGGFICGLFTLATCVLIRFWMKTKHIEIRREKAHEEF